MTYPSIYENSTTTFLISRLNKLNSNSAPQWGKMNASQMLHHLNLTYDTAFHKYDPKTPAFVKFMLKTFVKSTVVGDKPYKKNTPTAKYLVMTDQFDFEKEKEALISNLKDTQEKGPTYFEGKDSNGFGKLTSKEWSQMLYKHIDHHFTQFGI
jgi:hypothetical protein